MFKFLKDKLKKAVSIFSKKVEEEAEIKQEEKEVIKPIEEKPTEPVTEKPAVEEPLIKEAKAEPEEEAEEPSEEPAEEEPQKEEPEEEAGKPEPKEEPEEEKAKEEIQEEIKELKEEFEKEVKEIEKEKTPVEIEEEIKEIKHEFEEEIAIVEEDEEEKTEQEIEEEIRAIKEEFDKELEEVKEEKAKAEKAPEEEKAPEKKSLFKKIFGKKEKPKEEERKEEEPEKEKVPEEKPSLIPEAEKEKPLAVEEKAEGLEEEPEVKKGFFKRIKETFTTVKLSEEKFEQLFWELEVVLMENNVAVEVIEKIRQDLKKELTTGKMTRKKVDEIIEDSLRESIKSLFVGKRLSLVDEIKKKKDKPYIIAFIGVNGSGKTTTMAKIASLIQKSNLSVVFAASDTFRAAAIQQLQEHADNLGIKMIKHDYESDPAAVAFDAVKHAQSKGIDVVMIDTAGRLHSNDNLMNELKKLVRVNKPDLKIFVGESITGNDCVEQAKLFNEAVGIDAIVLAKADVDEKGGAAVSVSYVTGKPIIYLGTGQRYEDLTEFEPEIIIKNIGL